VRDAESRVRGLPDPSIKRRLVRAKRLVQIAWTRATLTEVKLYLPCSYVIMPAK
jgi:hypothetical protein